MERPFECPHCGRPATTIILEPDGSRRGACDACSTEWWIRSTEAPDRD